MTDHLPVPQRTDDAARGDKARYRVVASTDLADFVGKVDCHVKAGWRPAGGVAVMTVMGIGSMPSTNFYQALERP